jgi:glycosyltransferase involved in cell wall biosynthesis
MRPMFVTGSLVHGGAERHSITVMNRLADRGHECHAVYVKDDPSQVGRIRLALGGTIRCLDARSYFDPAALHEFAGHLRHLRPSALVAANGYALMVAGMANLLSGVRAPLIATFHTTQIYDTRERIKLVLERPFFWQADQCVFVSGLQRDYWLPRGVRGRRNTVIWNGVDTAYFNDRDAAVMRGTQRAVLGYAGSDYVIAISAVLRPEKNHVQLVEALAALRAGGIPARLLIIGDGPTRPAIEDRARRCGVRDAITITGFQQDVRPFVAAADVMVLCSVAVETFSLAALEAMAMGRPVIHAELGGAAEMIDPGHNGLLFPVGDTPALVEALRILSRKALAVRMGRRAREVVQSKFSEHAMVDRYEELLLESRNSQPRNGPPRKVRTKAQEMTQ